MKKLLIMFLILPLFTIAQVDHIVGKTYFDTPVYSNQNEKYIGNLPIWTSVIIEDATKKYYIIQYEDGHGYVGRFNVKCENKQLKELKIFRLNNPLTIKPISKQINDSLLNTETVKINTLQMIDDKYKYEIDHIRYCAGRYNKQVMTSYVFSLIGAIVTTGGAFTEKPKIPVVVGAGLGLIGSFLIIDSYKWMKKMYVGPDGVGIKYKF